MRITSGIRILPFNACLVFLFSIFSPISDLNKNTFFLLTHASPIFFSLGGIAPLVNGQPTNTTSDDGALLPIGVQGDTTGRSFCKRLCMYCDSSFERRCLRCAPEYTLKNGDCLENCSVPNCNICSFLHQVGRKENKTMVVCDVCNSYYEENEGKCKETHFYTIALIVGGVTILFFLGFCVCCCAHNPVEMQRINLPDYLTPQHLAPSNSLPSFRWRRGRATPKNKKDKHGNSFDGSVDCDRDK